MFTKKPYHLLGWLSIIFGVVMLSAGCTSSDNPPQPPAAPSGHTRGRIGITYTFKVLTTDPDADNVAVKFDWGDGLQSEWSDFVASGDTVSLSHSYSDSGTYQIKAEAKDDKGKESDWSPIHKIIIGNKSFYDDFSSYSVSQEAPFGEWKIAIHGIYQIEQAVQPDSNTGNILKADMDGDTPSLLFIDGDWLNDTFEVDTKDGEPGIYFRLCDEGSRGYYVTKASGYNTSLVLYKFSGGVESGTEQKIAESDGFNPEGWWHLKILLNGASIKIYANDSLLIDIVDDDPSLSSGGIGIGSRYGSVHFDNIKVEPIE